jgi:hypothetical protein
LSDIGIDYEKRRKQYKYANRSATAIMLLILAFTTTMALLNVPATMFSGTVMLTAFGTVCFLLWLGGTPWTAYRIKDFTAASEGPVEREWICRSNFYPVKAEGKTREESRKNLHEALKQYQQQVRAGN